MYLIHEKTHIFYQSICDIETLPKSIRINTINKCFTINLNEKQIPHIKKNHSRSSTKYPK